MQTTTTFNFKTRVEDREYAFSIPAPDEGSARAILAADLEKLSKQLTGN